MFKIVGAKTEVLLISLLLLVNYIKCGVIRRAKRQGDLNLIDTKTCACGDGTGGIDISSSSKQMDTAVSGNVTLKMCFEQITASAGYNNATWDKFQQTRRIVQKMAEYRFLGEINSLTGINPFVSEEMLQNGANLSPCGNLLFDGDLVLTEEQMDDIVRTALDFAGVSLSDLSELFWEDYKFGTPPRERRSVNADTDTRWSMPILYRVEGSVNGDAVKKAVQEWEENTCVTFKKTKLSLRRLRGNYINIKGGDSCSSNIGKKTKKEGQTILLTTTCARKFPVVHELGHALGMWHEHSRPDRDKEVKVDTAVVDKDYLGQFLRLSASKVSNLGLAYDHGSIMHYKSTAFGVAKGAKTIEATGAKNQLSMGQRQQLSFNDAKAINLAYCSDVCKKKLNCLHGGYEDPKNCRVCRCPEGLEGKTCNKAATSSRGCGNGDLEAKKSKGKVSVSGKKTCYWRIKSSGKVKITITDLNFQCRRTCRDFLELKVEKEFGRTGGRFCCAKPKSSFTSENNVAVIIYKGKADGKLKFEYSKA